MQILFIAFMLKQTVCISFLNLAVIIPATSLAKSVQKVPNPQQINGGWVTDRANILNTATETKLNQMISQLEAENGSEIALVTVPETAPSATPKEFTTDLFNYWKIGKAGQDNGVLFLISKSDRRVEIETGYGVEEILPDARVRNIIQQEITPRFKKGDFNGGTLAGTKALIVALTDAPANPSVTNTPALHASADQPSTSIKANQPSPYGWLAGIGSGVGLLTFIVYKLSKRPLFIQPEGRSRVSNWGLRRPLYCDRCQQPLERLDSTSMLPLLTQPEQVAQNLGSISFEGWQCSNCRPHLLDLGIHIRAYVSGSTCTSECPTCQELTVTKTSKILRHATQYSEGKRLITYDCHCCSYHKVIQERIPKLPPLPPPPPPPSSSSSSGGSSGCSGGSDFGGGSSGGGGSGGSW